MYRPIVKLNTNSCRVCKRIFKSEKALKDHIFNRRVNDKRHILFKKQIISMRFENAKIQCPVCKQKMFRSIGMHFKFAKNNKHKNFLKEQRKFLVNKYLKGIHCSDLLKIKDIYTANFSYKYITSLIIKSIGKSKFDEISKKIFSDKRKEHWRKFPIYKRKQIMEKVREAEWSKLSAEERRNHPWVIAGKKASLESSKRGSKNQKYAFELLKKRFPKFRWEYNYALNNEWHVDIAAPDKSVFIEWDGRHHFISIHGQGYLNNRINRDKIKNKMITQNLNGFLIRVKDEGRANQKFVEEKIIDSTLDGL